MKRPRVFFRLFICLFFFPVFSLPAQSGAPTSAPAWFVYEKGRESFRKGEFGEALKAVKHLTENFGEIPEAHFLQAGIYEQEGEYLLAEKFYKRALELRRQLYVLEDRYSILYHLADIYRNQKRYKDYEGILLEILRDHEIFSAPRYSRLRDSLVRTLSGEGFDGLVLLYRIPHGFAERAHREIGLLYTRTGRTYQAVLHLSLATLSVVSALAEELKIHDPDYGYTTLKDALERSGRRAYLQDFIGDTEFFKSLYFLASSLYSQGSPAQAAAIWRIVNEYAVGELKTLSRNQLVSPKPEPLIVY
jgi:tetratricopeptide (TPR) repeat protein